MSNKLKSNSSAKAKVRNPISLNPLMKKSHVHDSSVKAKRAKEKQTLKKEWRRGEFSDDD